VRVFTGVEMTGHIGGTLLERGQENRKACAGAKAVMHCASAIAVNIVRSKYVLQSQIPWWHSFKARVC